MKTNKWITFSFMLIAAAAFLFSGCKKDRKDDLSSESVSLQQLSKDEVNVQNASDEALNDANAVLSGGNQKSTEMFPCHATIDSTSVINDTITIYITYNGPDCRNKFIRTGQVEVRKRVGTHWWQPGATVMVHMIDFTITRISNGKSMTLNGTKTFQNVTGGCIWQLGNGLTSIIHKTWGTVEATFDDNTIRTWNIARQRTFTGTPFNLVMTIDGFGTAGEYDKLVVWGINRHGEEFYTQITQSVVHKQLCDMDPCSGIKIHQIPSKEKSATITFGYNDNNEPVTGDECPTRFRVDWVKGNNSGTLYLPLH